MLTQVGQVMAALRYSGETVMNWYRQLLIACPGENGGYGVCPYNKVPLLFAKVQL